jgi:hypothetical protein
MIVMMRLGVIPTITSLLSLHSDWVVFKCFIDKGWWKWAIIWATRTSGMIGEQAICNVIYTVWVSSLMSRPFDEWWVEI